MEEKVDGGKKVRRIFTAEQKLEILKDIERCNLAVCGFLEQLAAR